MYGRDSFEHAPRQPHSAHNPANPQFLSPIDSQTCAHSLLETLSFDRLPQNAPGVGWSYSLVNTHPSSSLPASLSPAGGSNRLNDSSASSPLKIHNFKLPTASLTPFPANLTSTRLNAAKAAPLSPIIATLTDTPSRNSSTCHSYEKQRG